MPTGQGRARRSRPTVFRAEIEWGDCAATPCVVTARGTPVDCAVWPGNDRERGDGVGVNERTLLDRVRNNPRDVRFTDLLVLVEAFGYTWARTTGSHRIYEHPDAPLVLNLQPDKHGKAKEYQVRKFLRDVDVHGLRLEDES